MPLNKTQKDKRDRMVETLDTKISEKRQQIERNNAQAQDLEARLQAEVDEQELLKQALENLK